MRMRNLPSKPVLWWNTQKSIESMSLPSHLLQHILETNMRYKSSDFISFCDFSLCQFEKRWDRGDRHAVEPPKLNSTKPKGVMMQLRSALMSATSARAPHGERWLLTARYRWPWLVVCGWCARPGSSWRCPHSWCTRPPYLWWPGASRRSTSRRNTDGDTYEETHAV